MITDRTPKAIDFQPWHQLLGEYVNARGQVDYCRWQADGEAIADLQNWLAQISILDIESLEREVGLALLINLYNALTIRQVLEKYPIRSVRPSIMGVPNLAAFKLFFAKPIYRFGTQKLSLDAIEHDLLRQRFSEPRIHFALVCASIGCPALRNEAYWPETIDAQLEDAANQFINDENKVRYNSATQILQCSKIFQWYEQDFLAVSDSVVAYIQRYRKEKISSDTSIEYLPYDWQLNELTP